MCSRTLPPPPKKKKGETEETGRLRKPDTNRVPWRHSNLCKIMSLDSTFYEVTHVNVKVIEINNNTEVNSLSIFRVNLQFGRERIAKTEKSWTTVLFAFFCSGFHIKNLARFWFN